MTNPEKYDIDKYDGENHIEEVFGNLKEIDALAKDILDGDDIFEIKRRLDSMSKWSLKYFFYNALFVSCKKREHARFISLLFEKHPPKCSDLFLKHLIAAQIEMFERLSMVALENKAIVNYIKM